MNFPGRNPWPLWLSWCPSSICHRHTDLHSVHTHYLTVHTPVLTHTYTHVSRGQSPSWPSCIRPRWCRSAAAWSRTRLPAAGGRWGAPGHRRARPEPETSRRRCGCGPDPLAPAAAPSLLGPGRSRWCRGSHHSASTGLQTHTVYSLYIHWYTHTQNTEIHLDARRLC